MDEHDPIARFVRLCDLLEVAPDAPMETILEKVRVLEEAYCAAVEEGKHDAN